MPILKQKVFAYITCGAQLLVFRHPFAPEAGIQVPAGTVKDGEHPDDAVLREAYEETGLHDLAIARFLGEQLRDMSDYGRDELHHRRFYHLTYGGQPLPTWRHIECDPSDGSAEQHVFELFWVRLPDQVPALIADHGAFLPWLLDADDRGAREREKGSLTR